MADTPDRSTAVLRAIPGVSGDDLGPCPDPRLADPAEELLSEEMAILLVRFGVRGTAEKLGVSERTLRREYVKAGRTALEHVHHTRRTMALRLLVSRRPISEVARALGFASTQTFSRFVRREFGLTPTALHKALFLRRRPR